VGVRLVLGTVVVAAFAAAAASAAPVALNASQMALTSEDFDQSTVSGQGSGGDKLIAASSGYHRSFLTVQYKHTKLLNLQNVVTVGKSANSAKVVVSNLDAVVSSPIGRAALLKETATAFATAAHIKLLGSRIVRARALKAGDDAVEIVFSFRTASGSIVVGEEFVNVDRVLSTVEYGSTASLSATAALTLAKTMAAHIDAVLFPAPTNTGLPTVTGTPATTQTLTASNGVWTGAPTFAYQWQRCNAMGASCVPIAGATTSTYIVSTADIGSTLAVSITATNPTGTATAQSVATAAVAA
jgi:hypothetical protein